MKVKSRKIIICLSLLIVSLVLLVSGVYALTLKASSLTTMGKVGFKTRGANISAYAVISGALADPNAEDPKAEDLYLVNHTKGKTFSKNAEFTVFGETELTFEDNLWQYNGVTGEAKNVPTIYFDSTDETTKDITVIFYLRNNSPYDVTVTLDKDSINLPEKVTYTSVTKTKLAGSATNFTRFVITIKPEQDLTDFISENSNFYLNLTFDKVQSLEATPISDFVIKDGTIVDYVGDNSAAQVVVPRSYSIEKIDESSKGIRISDVRGFRNSVYSNWSWKSNYNSYGITSLSFSNSEGYEATYNSNSDFYNGFYNYFVDTEDTYLTAFRIECESSGNFEYAYRWIQNYGSSYLEFPVELEDDTHFDSAEELFNYLVNNQCKDIVFPYDYKPKFVDGDEFVINSIQGQIIDGNPKGVFDGFNGSVVLQNSITTIGEYAFYKFTEMSKVELSTAIETIGESAFQYATFPEIYELPVSLKTIGELAFDSCENLKTLIIKGGIQYFSKNAFENSSIENLIFENYVKLPERALENCDKLKSITFWGDLDENIAPYTFSGCELLEQIQLPKNIRSIGTYAFANCYNLQTIKFPDSIEQIDANAFSGCRSLNHIVIPSSVMMIGQEAFMGCSSLNYLIIEEGVKYIDGSVFKNCSFLRNVVIPSSAIINTDEMFYGCNRLNSVKILCNIDRIEKYAFCNCSALRTVYLPRGLKLIAKDAFAGCSSMKNVYFDGTLDQWYGIDFATASSNPLNNDGMGSDANLYVEGDQLVESVVFEGCTEVKAYVFCGCASVKQVTIPTQITSFAVDAFKSCNNLNDVYFDGTIKEWLNINFENDGANPLNNVANLYAETNTLVESVDFTGFAKVKPYVFTGCNSIRNVTIPTLTASFGSNVFNNVSDLQDVYYEGNISQWCDIEFADEYANPLNSGANLNIDGQLPGNINLDGVTNIEPYAFYGYSHFKQLTIPSSVATIGKYAFSHCGFYNLTISNGVKEIGDNAFEYCSYLGEITIPGSITTMGSNIFEGCSNLESLILAEGVTSIPRGLGSVRKLTFPNTVTFIANGTFDDSNLREVHYTGTLQDWCNIDFQSGTAAVYYNSSYGSYYTEIKLYVNDILIGATLELEGVTKIKPYAFYDYDDLTNLIIPDTVTEIGAYAFGSCRKITDITIQGAIQTMGSYAFSYCSTLNNLTLSDNVSIIGDYAFYNCSGLINVIIPGSVKTIGDSAFEYCNKLKNVTLQNGITTIGSGAFAGCSNLTEITIPLSVVNIKSSAFGSWPYLKTVRYTGTLGQWCSINFEGASANPIYNADELYINDNLIDEELTIQGISVIKPYVFYGYDRLKTVTISEGVTNIGDGVFYSCQNLTTITIPEGVETIGEDMFMSCNNLTEITIPSSIVNIKNNAFYYCDKLQTVHYLGTIGQWCSIDFENYSSTPFYSSQSNLQGNLYIGDELAQEVTIKDLTVINAYAFYGCASITKVTISDGVTTIGDYAFAYCSNLNTLVLPRSVESIESYAFYNSRISKLYYTGTSQEFNALINNVSYSNSSALLSGTQYFKINGEQDIPSASGNWWYYDDDDVTIIDNDTYNG